MSAQERTPDDDLADQVCANGDCTNRAQQGTIYCYHCLHGGDYEARPEAIAAKRRRQEQWEKEWEKHRRQAGTDSGS